MLRNKYSRLELHLSKSDAIRQGNFANNSAINLQPGCKQELFQENKKRF
jgi:hypothetical protein